MQDEAKGSVSTTLLAFLAGAAIGGLVVALTTPKRGEDLRADLNGLGRRMKEKAEDVLDSMSGKFEEGRRRAGQAASEVKEGVAEAVQDLRG